MAKVNRLGSKMRNKHMLDIKHLIRVAREREEELMLNTNLHFMVEKNNINLEDLYRSDLISKVGFVVDTDIRYEKQGADAGLIDLDSILSYKFGVKESDPVSVKEKKYTCNCEEENIKKAGEYCHKCQSYAIEHKYRRGWICLENYKVFNPDLLNMLIKNKKPGVELRKPANYREDRGNPDKYPWLSNPDFKYNLLALQSKDVLREFIMYISKPEHVDHFLDRIDMFMTDKIPVLSKNLRHHQVITKLDGTPDIRSHEINSYLFLINNKVDDLNKTSAFMSTGRKLRYLVDINKGFVNIHEEICTILGSGKESEIRGKVGGKRKGSSSKLIIEGSMSHITHEATLSYASFGVMSIDWHYDLYIQYGLTAESEFRIRGMMPSKDDYPMLISVLKELQKQDLAWIACYRPPTLYRCSFQGMFISALTKDGAIRTTEINLGENFKGDHDKICPLYFERRGVHVG